MSGLKDIRARISSVKNTQKITSAMKLVSAAKLKKAQDNITNLRPYAQGILTMIADIAATQRISHPLMDTHRPVKKVLLVVLTSDRGLCGGFNANINKYAQKYYSENKNNYEEMDFFFIGRKARDYFKGQGIESKDTALLNLAKDISYELASDVAEKMIEAFTKGGYDEIRLVYNAFKNAITQELTAETLLPIDLTKSSLEGNEQRFSKDLIFEPEPEEIVEELLYKHFAVQVYRCMSESIAAEHAARMTAMENATNNANDMIDGLTLTYNKLRQAAITKELIEIVSGAEAL